MGTVFRCNTNAMGPPPPVIGDLVCYEDVGLTKKIAAITDLDLGIFPYNEKGNVNSTGSKTVWVKNESNYDALLYVEVDNPDVTLSNQAATGLPARINKAQVVERFIQSKLILPGTGEAVRYNVTIKGEFLGAPK